MAPDPKVIHVPMSFEVAKVVFMLLAETKVSDSRVPLDDLVGLKRHVEALRGALNIRREMG